MALPVTTVTDHSYVRVRNGCVLAFHLPRPSLFVRVRVLAFHFPLAHVYSTDVIGVAQDKVSRAMVMLRVSSRTRGYVVTRAACMGKCRLKSTSSRPFLTTAVFVRPESILPDVRSYRLTFTSKSCSDPTTSHLKIRASTSRQ